tara:strand:- start:489 stop:1241 length:753 start_codon:yes stop_codon:yes gene_type:complete
MYLVYLAAGLSSRFGGEPKLLQKIGKGKKSLIEISLQQSLVIDFEKIIFIVSDNTYEIIKLNIDKLNLKIPVEYIFQRSERIKPWGTAHAVSCLYPYVDKPFVLCNSDDLYGNESFNVLKEHINTSENLIVGFKLGCCLPNNNSNVNRGFINLHDGSIVEKLNICKSYYSNHDLETIQVSMNLFLLQPDILQSLFMDVEDFILENQLILDIEALLPVFLKKYKFKVIKSDAKCLGITYKDDINELKNIKF